MADAKTTLAYFIGTSFIGFKKRLDRVRKIWSKIWFKNVSVQFKSVLTAVAVQGTACSNSSTISKEPKIAKLRHAITFLEYCALDKAFSLSVSLRFVYLL